MDSFFLNKKLVNRVNFVWRSIISKKYRAEVALLGEEADQIFRTTASTSEQRSMSLFKT